MAYPTSSERYSPHISNADDSISSGAYPSAADRARYPDLYPTTEEVVYSTQRASQPTETTPASQQLLLDRPSGTYHYSCSLAPAIIGMVRSAFPNAGPAEVGDLVQELTELVRQRKKEARDRHAQQTRWIGSLENHVRELNFQIAGYQRTIRDVDARLRATGLLDPRPAGTGFLGAHYGPPDAADPLSSSSAL